LRLCGGREADRQRLAPFLKELLDGCLAHQRADGLFHDVVDRPESFVETNLAQMLAFSIYTGVAGGWLPASYVPAADRMRAAARAKVDQYGFVQGVCGAPRFDSAGVATEGQAFFLMMEVAGAKPGAHPANSDDPAAATCYHFWAMKTLLLCALLAATAYPQAIPTWRSGARRHN